MLDTTECRQLFQRYAASGVLNAGACRHRMQGEEITEEMVVYYLVTDEWATTRPQSKVQKPTCYRFTMQVGTNNAPGWDSIERAVDEIISGSPDPFDSATIANVQDLIAGCRDLCRVPEGTAKGYWSTIRFCWENLEVEVCDDHYEFYRFKQGSTDIEHFDHTPGTSVPAELTSHLPTQSPLHD